MVKVKGSMVKVKGSMVKVKVKGSSFIIRDSIIPKIHLFYYKLLNPPRLANRQPRFWDCLPPVGHISGRF